MGQGTMQLFNDFALQMGEGDHDLPSGGEDYKAALITNAVVATAADAGPELADYTECSGGTYAAIALANQDFTLSGATATFIADAIEWAKDAVSGPTDCYQMIIYIDDGAYRCFAFMDLTLDGGTTPLSLQDAAIGVNFGAGTGAILTAEVDNT